MKKILITFLLIGIYLNRAYAQFYDSLGSIILLPPSHGTETTIGNTGGEILRFAALGDSLTEGVGVPDYKLSFPFLIASKMPTKEIKLINLARAGAMSKDVLIYQIPRVIPAMPDLVTILIGINDIHNLVPPEEFRDNLTQSVKFLKEQTKAKIYLLSIPYLGSDKIVLFPYNFVLDLRTKQFNNIIRKIAGDFKAEFVDLYSLEKPADFYSGDQFHPSGVGYKQWSGVINVN